MNNNQIFLELYNQLDIKLREKYNVGPTDGSVIMRYITELRNSNYQKIILRGDQLDVIRNLRNDLVHNLKINNSDTFTVNENVIEFLKEELDILEHPILVSDRYVDINNVYTAGLNTIVKNLIMIMKDRGYSYIPIVDEKNYLLGAFSALSLMDSWINNHKVTFDKDTKVSDLINNIKLESHNGRYFMFVPINEELEKVTNEYLKNASKGRKLALIFVTKNGKPNEPVLGILAPYDLLYR